MPSPSDFGPRRAAFRVLHERGCFVMPNPWDPGSAQALASMGFRALATTSAGFAFSRGLPDAADVLSLESVLGHVAEIVSATDLPVNADFQSGYAADAQGVAKNVRRCVETGVAGLSIEDRLPEPAARGPLFEIEEAIERIAAARAAIDQSGAPVLLTGRAECFLVGDPAPLEGAIARLTAYAEAGADVLFAPGVREPAEVRAIVEAVRPKPLNLLVGSDPGQRVSELGELGVRRISVGSALSRVAWGAFSRAATALAAEGSFVGLKDATPFAELNALFGAD